MSLRRTTHPFDRGVPYGDATAEEVDGPTPLGPAKLWRDIDDRIFIDTPPLPKTPGQQWSPREHPRKYMVGFILSCVSLVVGVLLGIAYIPGLPKLYISLEQRLIATTATNVPTVSVLPTKDSSSGRRRRLDSHTSRDLGVNDDLHQTSDVEGDDTPSLMKQKKISLPLYFDSMCDYNLAGNVKSTVQDPAAASAAIVSQIACQFAQLRISDIGLNATYNPGALPYVALVDESLCGGQGITTWYVASKGPIKYGGDGEYISNAKTVYVTDQDAHMTLTNTVINGQLASSKLVFYLSPNRDRGEKKGCLYIDTTVMDRTDASFVLQERVTSKSTRQLYLHTSFNNKFFVGGAASNNYVEIRNSSGKAKTTQVTYGLDFVANAINHKATTGSSSETKCIDYSRKSRIFVADDYTLYSASTGAKKTILTGMAVQASFPDFVAPVSAYVSLGGVLADNGLTASGSYIDATSRFVSGLPMKRLNYRDLSKPESVTLQVSPAKLMRVSRKFFKLSEIVNLAMTVTNTPNSRPIQIMWDGSNLVTVALTQLGCINEQTGVFANMTMEPMTQTDCECLNYIAKGAGDYRAVSRTSGPYNNSLTLQVRGINNLSPPYPVFTPTTADYPHGLDVTAGQIEGHIQLHYEFIQTLYGIYPAFYPKGTPIAQNGTKANATVYETSPRFLRGLNGTFELDVQYTNVTDCNAGQLSANETISFVPAGAAISQNILSVVCSTNTTKGNDPTMLQSFSSSLSSVRGSVKVGMMVTGDGIPPYTFITAVTSVSAVMSNPAFKSSADTRFFWATGVVNSDWSGSGGLAFSYTGSAEFTVAVTAKQAGKPKPGFYFSLPVSDDGTPINLGRIGQLSGYVEWDSNTGLSLDPADVVIRSPGSGCCGPKSVGDLCTSTSWTIPKYIDGYPSYFAASNVPIVTDTATTSKVQGALMSFKSWQPAGPGVGSPKALQLAAIQLVDITNPGKNCVGDVSGDVSHVLTGGFIMATVTSGYCSSSIPTFTFKCNHRIDAISSSVKMLLSGPKAKKFQGAYSQTGPYPGPTYNLLLLMNGLGGGTPQWVTSEVGMALPITGDSKLMYTTERVVLPGESVGKLLCSSEVDECPVGSKFELPQASVRLTKGSTWIQLHAEDNYMRHLGVNRFVEGMIISGPGIPHGTTITVCYPSTEIPTGQPTMRPSIASGHPTRRPTGQPSGSPTGQPTGSPSYRPSAKPSTRPTCRPTRKMKPSPRPTRSPTYGFSVRPTILKPTGRPTGRPSLKPSRQPTSQPSGHPTSRPSPYPNRFRPTRAPTPRPTSPTPSPTTSYPSGQPSSRPSSIPSGQPTSSPTLTNDTLAYVTGTCVISTQATVSGVSSITGSWGTPTDPIIQPAELIKERPSHLDPDVAIDSGGLCTITGETYKLRATYTGISGADPEDPMSQPSIQFVWSPAYMDEKSVQWYKVTFMRMEDPGSGCSPDPMMQPTVTFSAPDADMLISATVNSNTFQVLNVYAGALAPGMPIAGDGGFFSAPTDSTQTLRIIGCSNYTDVVGPVKNMFTCTFNGIVSYQPGVQGTRVKSRLRGTVCKSLPAATISCASGHDVIDFRQAVRYSFDSQAGVLTDLDPMNGGPVVLQPGNFGGGDDISPSQAASFGAFFEDTPSNKAALMCDWDSSLACAFKLYTALPEYFYYSTGPGSPRYSLLDSTGAPISFDQPLPLIYTPRDTDSNSRESYKGVTMVLEYNGPGDLLGLPTVCLDDENRVTECQTAGSAKSATYPDLNIPPTAPLKDVISGEHYYALPSKQTEIYPTASDSSICKALNFSRVPAVPVFDTLYKDPANLQEAIPSATQLAKEYLNVGQPAVIAGATLYELQALE